MIVMKFGGTSVANFEAITRTIFIVGSKLDQKPVVVVSALSKVTDLLYKIADCAAAQDLAQTKEALAQLRERHVNLVKELLEQSPMLMEQALARVSEICDELDQLSASGRAFVIAPSRDMHIGRMESDLEKLGDWYWLGYHDAKAQMDALRKYLEA